MNLKSINSKLDFLENLIVEMNPDNLEELKNLCFEKISEISYQISANTRAFEIHQHTGVDIDTSYNLSLIESSYRKMLRAEIDVIPLLNMNPNLGDFDNLKMRFSVKDVLAHVHIPRIGDEVKLEFEKPKVLYDKPESKYFTKPKNNFKKR